MTLRLYLSMLRRKKELSDTDLTATFYNQQEEKINKDYQQDLSLFILSLGK